MAFKTYTFQEYAKHNTMKDCWLLIDGKVYDVTSFLETHPGGDDVMLLNTGGDASATYVEVQHSNMARELMKEYQIGFIDPSTCPSSVIVQPVVLSKSSDFFTKALQLIIPLFILVLAIAGRFYSEKEAVPSAQV